MFLNLGSETFGQAPDLPHPSRGLQSWSEIWLLGTPKRSEIWLSGTLKWSDISFLKKYKWDFLGFFVIQKYFLNIFP